MEEKPPQTPRYASQTREEREDGPAPTRRGLFGVLKKAVQDEVVRRTSTKR